LARVQGLVAREDRPELELGELVRSEIAAHQADGHSNIRIEGPPITLREKAAETLALALHELATNAIKYGALSDSSGRLVVTWRIRDDETLVLEWEETGVALKRTPRDGVMGVSSSKSPCRWRWARRRNLISVRMASVA
jgi:two-component system, chemotaxis family, CheB/CheR fusion protein